MLQHLYLRELISALKSFRHLDKDDFDQGAISAVRET